jgi:hypothetical protein
LEVFIRGKASKKVPNDEQRPFVAHNVECVGDRARRSQESRSLRSRPASLST